MTPVRRPKAGWRRGRAVLASVALLVLILGPAAVESTTAGWIGSGKTQGSFTSGKLGDVGSLTCTNQGILGPLLARSVRLDWTPPQNPPPVPYSYQLDVQRNGESLTPVNTGQTTYVYTPTVSLLSLDNYVFTVKLKTTTGNWTSVGKSRTATGGQLAVIGLYMNCGS